MKKVKVFIEKSEYGYSAYMKENSLDYGLIGEGKNVREAVSDFLSAYSDMKELYEEQGREFEESEFEFFYDVASFLQDFAYAFSLAGLERITGINQKQLGHYLNGNSRPSKKTVAKIQESIRTFSENLSSIRFA